MIPALITSALNRYDLLERMLRSIDEPIERGLISINGLGWNWQAFHYDLGNLRIVETGFSSLGWPGVLNFGLARFFDSPWWLFTNNDLIFRPGQLAELAHQMDTATGPLVISQRWAAFALNAAVIEQVGLFDEWSFWPLYFDDTDFAYRCHLAGVPVQAIDWLADEGADGHATSLTIHSDEELARANNRSWIVNQAAYVAKWGGRPGHETFTSPWNSGMPIWVTRPSLAGRQERRW
jgi:hypothetical protein